MKDRPPLGFAYLPPPGSVCFIGECGRSAQGAVLVYLPHQDGAEKIKIQVPSCARLDHQRLAEREAERLQLERRKELQEKLQSRRDSRVISRLVQQFDGPEPDLMERIDELLS